MASSTSHKLGELIGDFFEISIINYLNPKITGKGYYLDYRHSRLARNMQREVIGVDLDGNRHKLDIVIEKNGSEQNFGTPKAFIEMAWRRYTKHSKNKVQEIAGAIIPLAKTYAREIPFYAAVLAGEFTENSITQLESQGFYVLHFSYEQICKLFETINISIQWQESTSEQDLQIIVKKIADLNQESRNNLQETFFKMYSKELCELERKLSNALDNCVTEILIIPIHGATHSLISAEEAMNFVLAYDENTNEPILRYEITIKYRNGDEYSTKCSNKATAIRFLHQYT